MRIAVVDDLAEDREAVAARVAQWAAAQQVSLCCDTYAGGEAFLAALAGASYDLVLMDIYMGFPDGIETGARLHEADSQCLLVYLTSSKEHMPSAFSVHAFEYLVKPVETDRLNRVLDEALSFLPEKQRFITLVVDKQTVPVLYADIRSVLADSQYCAVNAVGSYRCRVAFGTLEKELSEDSRFLTVNRGILVNLDHVSEMEDAVCRMKDGRCFPLNIRKKSQLRQALIAYRFSCRAARLRRRGR